MVPSVNSDIMISHWELGINTKILQDNSADFGRAQSDPADGSPAFPGQPESGGGTEAKERACPSTGQRGRLAQHFQDFHLDVLNLVFLA
jgi:hypothetical protein